MKPEGTKNILQKRRFGLELSNADYRNLCEKAAMAGEKVICKVKVVQNMYLKRYEVTNIEF